MRFPEISMYGWILTELEPVGRLHSAAASIFERSTCRAGACGNRTPDRVVEVNMSGKFFERRRSVGRVGWSSDGWSARNVWGSLVLSAVAAATVSGCDGLFYFPSRELFHDPAAIGLPFRDVWFESRDGTRLHGWFFPADRQGRASVVGTVVHFHGNAENISAHAYSSAWLSREGFNVLVFDYRGYGESAGTPDKDGVQQDAIAAVRWVSEQPEVDPRRLVLFGQSLGAAIAVRVAADYRPSGLRCLVLESGFSSYRSIARDKLSQSVVLWPFQWPLSFLVSDRYSPARAIAKIAPAPVLIVHGTADPIVPYSQAEALYAAAHQPKTLWTIPGGGHISAFTRNGAVYREPLVAFLRRCVAETPEPCGDDERQRCSGVERSVAR
ncbi:MAG TPA: alpha/beta hydrolase [Nitrospiria bacterium]|nr:alpha/beta hydrolase [Nitrospiria bacterium]